MVKRLLICGMLALFLAGCRSSHKLHLVQDSPYVDPQTGSVQKVSVHCADHSQRTSSRWFSRWTKPSKPTPKETTVQQRLAAFPGELVLAVLGEIANPSKPKKPTVKVDDLELDYWKRE